MDLKCLTKLNRLKLSGTIKNIEDVSRITSLQTLDLSDLDLHEKSINFGSLINLTTLTLNNCKLWGEDLENLRGLKNNVGLTINLQNNAIIDASALLELDLSTKIYLNGNVNLNENSKTKLKDRFGANVSF